MRFNSILIFFFLVFISCKNNPVYIQRIEGKQLPISTEIEIDSSVNEIVAPYKNKLEKEMNQELAYAPVDLFRNREDAETNIGNFLADLCYKNGNAIFNQKTGKNIDFVLLNIGGIRANIAKGTVTTRNAYEVMPFENSMVVTELSYEKITELLEYLTVSKSPHPFSKQLQLVFENDKLVSALLNDKEFDKNSTYFVLTSDYLQHGGDKMDFFKDPITLIDLDYMIRTAIIDELTAIDTISAKVDGRVLRK
jgi:5'-nucleotidase